MSSSPTAQWSRVDPDALRVTKVLDGDTVVVEIDGEDVRVGIDWHRGAATDAADATQRCPGKLALTHLRGIERVRLFFDASQECVDERGRRLTHVRLPATGSQAGSEQLQAGYANTIHRTDYHEQELNYTSDDKEAKQNRAGLRDEISAESLADTSPTSGDQAHSVQLRSEPRLPRSLNSPIEKSSSV